jgi:hypothetical protein
MPRTTENVCLTLRPEIVRAVDAARGKGRDAKSRSQFVDLTLERALQITGESRLAELEEIAAAGREEYAEGFKRPRAPNATEVIAEASVEGHARLRALNKIAAGNRR